MKPEIGDTIHWSFPEDHGSFLAGKSFSAEIVHITDKGDCAVYAEYGPDYIPENCIEKLVKQRQQI